jgi:hypothetical protein
MELQGQNGTSACPTIAKGNTMRLNEVLRLWIAAVLLGGVAALPAEAAVIKVMALGDSMASGTDFEAGGGFRGFLQTLMASEAPGTTFDFVGTQTSIGDLLVDNEHEGYPGIDAHHNGIPADSLRLTLESNNVFSTLDGLGQTPDVILLHIGTNSFNGTFDQNSSGKLNNLLNYLSGVPELLSTKFIIAKIVPKPDDTIGESLADLQTRQNFIENYNDVTIPALVATHLGARAIIVDMFNAAAWTDPVIYQSNPIYFGPGGIHPTGTGYEVMADVWWDGIESFVVPEPGTIVLLASGGLFFFTRRHRRATS